MDESTRRELARQIAGISGITPDILKKDAPQATPHGLEGDERPGDLLAEPKANAHVRAGE